jgi:hypothetical protein
MQLLWVTVVVGALAACDAAPEQQRRDVCTAFCDCETGTPLALESCITDDCLPAVPAVSDVCLDCVYTYSQTCGELFNQCLASCFSQAQP